MLLYRQHNSVLLQSKSVDLLRYISRDNLYTLSLGNMMTSSPICLLSNASKTKSWLWHRRLSHLNFGAINHLARHGLVRGLPKLKFEKDHFVLHVHYAQGSKEYPYKPKSVMDTNQEKLYLFAYGSVLPMRVVESPEVIAPIPEVVAHEHAVSTGSPSSTTVDQDAPSPTTMDAFLTSVEPKNYKDALTQACWIEAMQEELHEFERLEVWELVPPPDKAFVITLKWIYKVKLDELGGILKNKARLVAPWLSSRRGIYFENPSLSVAKIEMQYRIF
ncbi:retrovirus-related pol polyprotein from transposon TNT 1-94 [Tanacetum coccineum]|uniref:Retrovirus-related pol polyprotein from transposon TNT 1-94 n=1 Tax=Tanacetum coccineum TaxID=301880 RepID=A0ABQ5HBT1_9ASTR